MLPGPQMDSKPILMLKLMGNQNLAEWAKYFTPLVRFLPPSDKYRRVIILRYTGYFETWFQNSSIWVNIL